MGTGVAAAYNSSLTSYNTAKTMWNNYVAILTKNAKVDAFAAAFAPPKAPTVPPLPNKPWLPAVSATMYKMSTANLGAFSVNNAIITASLQPATGVFWLNDDGPSLQTGGGWGSWTASVMTYRDDWGKVFGTIGYQLTTGTANASWNAKGAVYNQAWQCSATTVTTPAPSATTACPQKYTGATYAVVGTAGTPDANAILFYMAVSLWTTKTDASIDYAMAAACTGANISCFQITFSKGSWAPGLNALVAPASMAAAGAADSLSGIVGAQALAASAAAALAAAAALY